MMYDAGTWATTKEHERLIRTTQSRMQRLISQTKRRYRRRTATTMKESNNTIIPVKKESRVTADMTKTAAFSLKVTLKVTHNKITKTKTGWNTARGVPEKLKNMNTAEASRLVPLRAERWTRRAAEWGPRLLPCQQSDGKMI